MNIKNICVNLIVYSLAISYILIIIFAAIILLISNDMPFDGGFFKNFLILSGILCGIRLIAGGWSAYSLKGMGWQVMLSSITAIILIICGMNNGGTGISFWPLLWPIIVSAVVGVIVYNFIENVITDSIDIDADDVIKSVFDNGLKNTFNGFVDMCEDNVFYAAGRGTAAYSNTVLFLGLIIGLYYSV